MLTCHFCSATIAGPEEAAAAEWIPSFFFPGDTCETADPVCAKCCDDHLEQDDSGELICVTE